MKILICSERYIFRFGVDRILMILGYYFRQLGHHVTFMGNKMEQNAVDISCDRHIMVPECPHYPDSNEYTLKWLQNNWDSCFNEQTAPDVVLVTGWPFYQSIEFLRSKCNCVIFNDYGATPIGNISGPARLVQEKLQAFRKQALPASDGVIAISDFIKDSQSAPESAGKVPVYRVHCCADHMAMGLWTSQNVAAQDSSIVETVRGLKNDGYRLLFQLCRWENDNYKNSEFAFEIARTLKKAGIKAKILTLGKPEDIHAPEDVQDSVQATGFLSDEDMQAIMELCDLGVTVSKWEGFNLPLAEMQYLGKHVYAFNAGAHREVVAAPYYLCETESEFLEKVTMELQGKSALPADEARKAVDAFKGRFTGKNMAIGYLEVFTKLLRKKLTVIMDVTNACHDTANSGVMRVTRHLAGNLQRYATPIFALWDESVQRFVFPTEEELKLLCSYGGPERGKIADISPRGSRKPLPDEWVAANRKTCMFLATETMAEPRAKEIRAYFKVRGIATSAVFHDAIPVLHPEFCSEQVAGNHAYYMTGLAEMDVIFPNSGNSGKDLIAFWQKRGIPGAKVVCDLLPGELEGVPRATAPATHKDGPVQILCVSTLEPRKNHKTLLRAAALLQQNHPEVKWELNFVGNRYAGNEEIPAMMEEYCKKYPNMKWHGVVDDDKLAELYHNADFTMYPSIIEGYGMPITESLWNGKPCICSNGGVMAELAAGGGCLCVDVMDENAVANGMYTLCTDVAARAELERQALAYHMRTWEEYTKMMLGEMYDYLVAKSNTTAECYNFLQGGESRYSPAVRLWLAALLAEKKPTCAVLVGTADTALYKLAKANAGFAFAVTAEQCPARPTVWGSYAETMPVVLEEVKKAAPACEIWIADSAVPGAVLAQLATGRGAYERLLVVIGPAGFELPQGAETAALVWQMQDVLPDGNCEQISCWCFAHENKNALPQ